MFEHIIKQLWIVMKNAPLLLCLMIPNIALFDYTYRLILVFIIGIIIFQFSMFDFYYFSIKILKQLCRQN